MDSGWKSYNNRTAISFGFEYKEDRQCGTVHVRHPNNRRKVFTFSGHPNPTLFYMMEHYPTLVGLDDSKLCQLVVSKLESDDSLSRVSKEVESLKKTIVTNAASRAAQEQQDVEEHRNNAALHAALVRERDKVQVAREKQKVIYVKEICALRSEKECLTEKMKAMQKQIDALRQTCNHYKKKHGETNEILNLTSASLTALKDLPQQILTLQQQVNINLANKNYEFTRMARLLSEKEFVEKNAIMADFSSDFLRMLGQMPYHFNEGDEGILTRRINSRPYGTGIGSIIKTVIPEGKYTFKQIANILDPVTVFDLAFCSLRVQTTTVTHRFNKDRKKLLSSFSLKEILDNLNRYGANIDMDSVDICDKDYYLYCLSIILLKKNDASMVENAFEVMEPITLHWEEGNHAWRCRLCCRLRHYYRFQSTLKVRVQEF